MRTILPFRIWTPTAVPSQAAASKTVAMTAPAKLNRRLGDISKLHSKYNCQRRLQKWIDKTGAKRTLDATISHAAVGVDAHGVHLTVPYIKISDYARALIKVFLMLLNCILLC